MAKNTELVYSNRLGELEDRFLNRVTTLKYRPDNPFFSAFIPYLLMLVCGAVDMYCFKGLMDMVSYDNMTLKVANMIGLLIGFDVCPIFSAIVFRRIRQGMEAKEKGMLIVALSVTVLAVSLNILIRALTLDVVAPMVYTNAYADEAAIAAAANARAMGIATTVAGMVIPVVTSITSFIVSYFSYSPWALRSAREEKLLGTLTDQVRRIDAIIHDYEAGEEISKQLLAMDEERFRTALWKQNALALMYINHVRLRIAEHLADPASTSALTADDGEAILNRLEQEQKRFYAVCSETASESKNTHNLTMAS